MCDEATGPTVADDSHDQEVDAPFNVSTCNRTAVECCAQPEKESAGDEENGDDHKKIALLKGVDAVCSMGNDSGVEVAQGEYASSGAPEGLSCASSLISCGSACEDSFDVLSCNNGDRLEDFKNGTAGDGTSEGGSESSSITGSGSGRGGLSRKHSGAKKRVAVSEPGKTPRPKPSPVPRSTQGRAPALATRERARSREKSVPGDKPPPPTGPKPVVPPRSRPRTTPDSLALICRESPSVKVKATKTSTARCRTPGQAPSPLAANSSPRIPTDSPFGKSRLTPDSKAAFDKYATLPRRKRENSPELSLLKSCSGSTENSLYKNANIRRSATRERESPPLRILPPYPKSKFTSKIKIYHETSVQTALYGSDVENALAGVGIKEIRTDLVLVKKTNKGVQVDNRNKEMERLEAKIKLLTEANSKLQTNCSEQAEKIANMENRLEEERNDKVAAQEELQRNTQRVLSMLGGESGECGDSLLLLESQLQTSANIVIKQQEEINKLHTLNRGLQQELNKSAKAYQSLENHLEETEQESNELQEFLQAEKSTLQEALRESEENILKLQREVTRSRRECRLLVRISEQRRHEILAARARLAVNRPSQAAPVALPTLAQRLQSLLHALISTYSISPDDLEEVIFHNEAFSRSASSDPCSPGSPLARPQLPSSLPVQPTHFLSSRFSDDDNSADLLDSETEPCLMMENVLEDVGPHDTYSHNFVSSGISIMSCPNVAANHLNEDVPHTCPILIGSHQTENRRLRKDNKEDSFSSLHNITTFSGDDLSPAVPDEKPISESSYYPDMDTFDLLNMGYSEHDSLQNLSQAILHRQQSEAECSMSEDALNHRENHGYSNMSNSVVDQVIVVDNLVAKLLKVLKIIQSISNGGHVRTPKDKLNNISEEMSGVLINKNENNTDVNKKIENSAFDIKCDTPIDKNTKNCTIKNHVNSQMCAAEEQSSPRHSVSNLTDCNVNSPQPIDSAA